MLDELIAPLYHHIANLLAQPIDGTDAKRESVQTKKAYLEVLVAIMSGRLYVVFVSESEHVFCHLVGELRIRA